MRNFLLKAVQINVNAEVVHNLLKFTTFLFFLMLRNTY